MLLRLVLFQLFLHRPSPMPGVGLHQPLEVPANALDQPCIPDRVQSRIWLAVITPRVRQYRLYTPALLVKRSHQLALLILAVRRAQGVVQRQCCAEFQAGGVDPVFAGQVDAAQDAFVALKFAQRIAADSRTTFPRSEERRVGKECRSRWEPY